MYVLYFSTQRTIGKVTTMNLRSGKMIGDKFEIVLDSMKELYPTVEQVDRLTINATRMDELFKHVQWLMRHHGPPGKNHHLIIFAVIESILVSAEHLWSFMRFRKILQTARKKLAECENTDGEFTRCQYITRINRAIGTD